MASHEGHPLGSRREQARKAGAEWQVERPDESTPPAGNETLVRLDARPGRVLTEYAQP